MSKKTILQYHCNLQFMFL